MDARSARLVVASARSLLSNQRKFLRSLPLEVFTSPGLRGATVGQHFRHALDHIAKPLDSDTRARSGKALAVHYDVRERGTDIELDINAAIAEIDRIERLLKDRAFLQGRFNANATVIFYASSDGDEVTLKSTLGRELFFAIHHAVHHESIAKAIILDDLGHSPFAFDGLGAMGIAPSTSKYTLDKS